MAVPTKEAGRTEPRDGAAPELSSIQFSAQFTEEITESQEPQPDTHVRQQHQDLDHTLDQVMECRGQIL